LIKCKRLFKTEKNIKKRRLTSQEVSKIKKADIVFVRNNSFISKKIREIIKSEWSHVAVYYENGLVFDTDIFDKVGLRSINEFDEIEIKRYLNLDEYDQQKIINYVKRNTSKSYDYVQVFGFILEYVFGFKNKIHEAEKYTCGKLIDLAFKEAGVDLFDGKDGDVTPKELNDSKKLKKII
jgi:hypothetical protein